PAQVDLGELAEACQEHRLDLGLVDVHERREMIAIRARQPDLEELAAAEVGAPQVPLNPALGNLLADPEPRPNLERLALHAERLAPLAGEARVLLEQDHPHSMLR